MYEYIRPAGCLSAEHQSQSEKALRERGPALEGWLNARTNTSKTCSNRS